MPPLPPEPAPQPHKKALRRYPALHALHIDITTLAAIEERRQADAERRRREEGQPPNVERVEVPWLGRAYWMDARQREVVRVLTEALASRSPEVHEGHLMRAAGASGGKLRDLFAGTPAAQAMGELVLPGSRGGYYHLSPPPALGGAGEEVRRVPPEE